MLFHEVIVILSVMQIDVYSFGIVMWELLTGDEPYGDMHCASIIGMWPFPNTCFSFSLCLLEKPISLYLLLSV